MTGRMGRNRVESGVQYPAINKTTINASPRILDALDNIILGGTSCSPLYKRCESAICFYGGFPNCNIQVDFLVELLEGGGSLGCGRSKTKVVAYGLVAAQGDIRINQ